MEQKELSYKEKVLAVQMQAEQLWAKYLDPKTPGAEKLHLQVHVKYLYRLARISSRAGNLEEKLGANALQDRFNKIVDKWTERTLKQINDL